MRVHANQSNPNIQLDAMYAAQKAAAKRETARTRKKLMEFASELAGEAGGEGCVVRLGEREQSLSDAKEQGPQNPRNRKRRNESLAAEAVKGSISDWA